ncbi:hypothetical protein QVD17_09394 [Tagetes erecta]|uniref:Alpha-ketoglutarate-dependent dioxygenase AlkB-like domain-containing protein n=1 Tax=Tagetes erecta TaxID=13708 RepID=A0AAD8P587_TARER|nr:hypothetical protein QVD17_09394 [Tagetes erecta]
MLLLGISYLLLHPQFLPQLPNVFSSHGPSVGMLKRYHGIPFCNTEDAPEPVPYCYRQFEPERPFSLFETETELKIKQVVHDMWRNPRAYCDVLRPGMVLLKNYLTLTGQVEIVNMCQKFAREFYQPRNEEGDELGPPMMCFGRNWHPVTKYKNPYKIDGSEPPLVPYQFGLLVEKAIKDTKNYEDISLMWPDICLVNFYPNASPMGQLSLHQDCDESNHCLDEGSPVVSISIGDSTQFMYGPNNDVHKLKDVLLESGDVLIFGGDSRLIFHRLHSILPNSAPEQLLQAVGLRPGHLNLTLREIW